jgi:2-polyprenyl-3-methyl-5-hydroxy-6-metoxy-1,4-benzoquinol methylase
VTRFDYTRIPIGFYDEVIRSGHPIRRAWHLSKFQRVLDCLPESGESLLDIGCFAGTFLSLVPASRFRRQLGVDILPQQIEYANRTHGTAFRSFRAIDRIADLASERFDCITLIEVIEHLTTDEIREMLDGAVSLLEPGGKLVLSTPNYASTWPLVELLLNRVSDISYEEQHLTKLNWFTAVRRLKSLAPRLADEASFELQTTTHFLTPFLAPLSFDLSQRLSRVMRHDRWHLPFGCLLLMVFEKR